MTEEEAWDEVMEYEAKEHKRLKWLAIRVMFSKKSHDDLGEDISLSLIIRRIGACLAIILNRDYKPSGDRFGDLDYEPVIVFNMTPNYFGYEWNMLEFNPRMFRFHINSDRDEGSY